MFVFMSQNIFFSVHMIKFILSLNAEGDKLKKNTHRVINHKYLSHSKVKQERKIMNLE